MNQPFTIRRSSSRKDDAFNSKEAATIALKAKVKHLIGHYSTRYEDISLLKRKQISFFQRCY
jgi:ribonuclease BN (tRNA processing enzyme)